MIVRAILVAVAALVLAVPTAQASTVRCSVGAVNFPGTRPVVSNLRATNVSCRYARQGADEIQYARSVPRTVIVFGNTYRVSVRYSYPKGGGKVLKFTLRRGDKRITFDGKYPPV